MGQALSRKISGKLFPIDTDRKNNLGLQVQGRAKSDKISGNSTLEGWRSLMRYFMDKKVWRNKNGLTTIHCTGKQTRTGCFKINQTGTEHRYFKIIAAVFVSGEFRRSVHRETI